MYLTANIINKATKNVSKIPRRSIFSDDKIFIVNAKNKLETTTVNIISMQGNNMIVNNLKNNTLVVIEPLINTKTGTKVKPIIK